MHLQDESAAQFFPAQRFVHTHHGQLDDIRRSSLHGRVHGSALAKLPHHLLGRLQLRQIAAAPHQRFRIAAGLAFLCCLFHKALYARIFFEISADKLLRLSRAHTGVAGKAKAADAVNQPEVDCLGTGAKLRRNLAERYIENLTGRARMNILACAERLQHCRIAGKVRHQPQLNLAVVRIQQHPSRLRQECLTDFLSLRGAHGDILQIRLR